MSQPVPIHFDPDVLAALEARAADIHASLSEVVNRLLQERLAEDLEDLAAFEERAEEPRRPIEEVMADFKVRGLL